MNSERLLIIEDDRSLYKPLKHIFESEGYAVDFAADGAAGLASVRAAAPDIVVLDLKLPRMHGREVCRAIKQETPTLPVVVLSALADEIDKVLLLSSAQTTTSRNRSAPGNSSRVCTQSCDEPRFTHRYGARCLISTRSAMCPWILPRWS